MSNQILAFVWKDLKIFFKEPGALVLIFLQPFMFIVVMSYALSGLFGSEEKPIPILAVNLDLGMQAATLLQELDAMETFRVETTWQGQPLTREMAEKLILDEQRNLVLVFPPEFSDILEQDLAAPQRQTVRIELLLDPAVSPQLVEPLQGTLQGLLERTAYQAMLPRGIDFLFDNLAPKIPSESRHAFKTQAQQAMSGGLFGDNEPIVTVERTVPPGMRVERYPDTFQQNVPGYTIYGIFWIVSLLTGSVLQEKQSGTFRRIMVAPIHRATLLAGKLLPYYLINLIQVVIMLGGSSLLFGMSLGYSPAGLVVVSLAAAATATGLGVLIASQVRTPSQASGLTVLLLLTFSALGGCFVPRFLMPAWLKTLGLITPHAWALDAYQDLLVRGYGLIEVLPKVGALAGFALVFFGIGVWRFRFDQRDL